MQKFLHWTVLSPLLAWMLYFSGLIQWHGFFQMLAGIALIFTVLSAVHHSEIIAYRVGEPFGTIILAVAITIIEVAIIISLMIAGGKDAVYLARDTIFSSTMLILNGILGACLALGSVKHFEQVFSPHATNTALISLVAIIVFTLVLPNFTTSISGPVYSEPQLIFIAIVCFIIYGVFILVQTVRHREYFLTDEDHEAEYAAGVGNKEALLSLFWLLLCLGIVVLLAKKLSPVIEKMVIQANLPNSFVGILIAAIILLPESIAAVKAAKKNKLQTSINLALGSALASIGLTIPAIAITSSFFDLELVLGLDTKSMILLALSVFIVMLSLSKGKSNLLYGVVLMLNLMVYLFVTIYP